MVSQCKNVVFWVNISLHCINQENILSIVISNFHRNTLKIHNLNFDSLKTKNIFDKFTESGVQTLKLCLLSKIQ